MSDEEIVKITVINFAVFILYVTLVVMNTVEQSFLIEYRLVLL